jgi:hypothetical protein
MRNNLFTFILFLLVSSGISAQDMAVPEISGFKQKNDYPVFTPENLWDFINGAADAYLALGFVDLHVTEYKKGKEVIKLEIYRHDNPTDAFGIYASERSPSFRFEKLGAQGYIADGAINFFKGNYYVKIRTYSKKEKTVQAAYSLAQRVSEMLPGGSEMPAKLALFPEEGKQKNSESYINESVLGHSFLNKAFKAEYQAGSDKFSIFIFDNNRNEVIKSAESFLKAAGIEMTDPSSGKYMINDGYNGIVFISWKDDILVLISGLAKDQADIADRYTSEILK